MRSMKEVLGLCVLYSLDLNTCPCTQSVLSYLLVNALVGRPTSLSM